MLCAWKSETEEEFEQEQVMMENHGNPHVKGEKSYIHDH